MENKHVTANEFCTSSKIEYSTFQAALKVLFIEGYKNPYENLSSEVLLLLKDCLENKMFQKWRKNGFKEDSLFKFVSADISQHLISLFVFGRISDKQGINSVFSAIKYLIKRNYDKYLNNGFLEMINTFNYSSNSIKDLRFKIFYAEQLYNFFNNLHVYYIPNRGPKDFLKKQEFMELFHDYAYYFLFIFDDEINYRKTFKSIQLLVEGNHIPFLNKDLLPFLNTTEFDKKSANRLLGKILFHQKKSLINYLEFEETTIDLELNLQQKYKFVEVKNLPVEDEENMIMRAIENGEGEKFGY